MTDVHPWLRWHQWPWHTTMPGWAHNDRTFEWELHDDRGRLCARITDEAVMSMLNCPVPARDAVTRRFGCPLPPLEAAIACQVV